MSVSPKATDSPQPLAVVASITTADILPSSAKEEKKEEEGQKEEARVYCYTDTDKPLTEEHLEILHKLKQYVDNIINHPDQYEWKYDKNESSLFEAQKLRPKLLPPSNDENNDNKENGEGQDENKDKDKDKDNKDENKDENKDNNVDDEDDEDDEQIQHMSFSHWSQYIDRVNTSISQGLDQVDEQQQQQQQQKYLSRNPSVPDPVDSLLLTPPFFFV
ncbi:hypothetical protein RFI_12117 [Reticulomyxa filosa]|uniref:Uncharacterized protein n=1 Tax=Reticulomyxa filosa TaxID=46433 RepID=X6NGB1_RETFI|nr:hypothetical protein RFI_12117 [Reticulomyxa filosa]|eukprot:ETO25026.1 hypothetical protein RFI_12117 [Reticulomyxa filosa]